METLRNGMSFFFQMVAQLFYQSGLGGLAYKHLNPYPK
jgi:hypothetical protein